MLFVCSCAGTGSGDSSTTGLADSGVGVASTVVSDGFDRQISVWAPKVNGSWPLVIAVHGLGGSRGNMSAIATELASEGLAVFAPNYRSTEPEHRAEDLACGYQHTMSFADQYGGDPNKPMAWIGHSLGAAMVLLGGLAPPSAEGTIYEECLTGALPQPDVIVAIAGCYYEFQDQVFEFDPSGWVNREADIILVAGEEDTICEPWQSEKAAEALREVGYHVSVVTIEGATHQTLVYHVLHSEADQVADIILDAVKKAAS